MSEWKKFNGSDEQKKEIRNADDVLFKMESGRQILSSALFVNEWLNLSITHYMICEPHPLADMICQQALTGQPVWVRVTKCLHVSFSYRYEFVAAYENYSIYVTTTPDWNIPGAEYSFKEELCK